MSFLTRPLHVSGNQVLTDSNVPIVLRGLNKGSCFVDQIGATWLGQQGWNPTRASQELDIMKAWGANHVRMHETYRYWKDNVVDPRSGMRHRDIVRAVAEMCAQKGLYFFFDGYCLSAYGEAGHQQDPLPFPPYSARDDIIGSVDEWITIWESIADALKDLPNVSLEPHNEPHGAPMSVWFSALQQCITRIRARGFAGLIPYQWDYGSWVNMAFPDSPDGSLEWADDYAMQGSNLMIQTHAYWSYGNFGFWDTGGGRRLTRTVDEMLQYMEMVKANYVMQTRPLYVGEFGGDVAYGDQALCQETYRNQLAVFNSLGVHYTGFWFRANYQHGMYTNDADPNGSINVYGALIREALLAGNGNGSVPLTIRGINEETGLDISVPVTLDGYSVGDTPRTEQVAPGPHTISVPPEVDV